MNLYYTKHTVDETELWELERKCLFHSEDNRGWFSIEEYVDVDRSPFVKFCIKDYITVDSLEELLETIRSRGLSVERFKVKYLDIEGSVEFKRRHEIEGSIGEVVLGAVDLNNPLKTIGVTQIDGKWLMGEYLKSRAIWLENKERPNGYCNALTNRVSRAILNIASGNDKKCRIIDPCCGIGTVVIEGLSMGLDIIGSDINLNIVRKARGNLIYFGYPVDTITIADLHEIDGHFDIAIVDLPYGILSITSKKLQMDIIHSAAGLCNKLAILGIEDISEDITKLGLDIIERCVIAKGNFKRNFYICLTEGLNAQV